MLEWKRLGCGVCGGGHGGRRRVGGGRRSRVGGMEEGVEEESEFPKGFRGGLVWWVVGRVVERGGGKQCPGVDWVERSKALLLCFGAQWSPDVGFEGGWLDWEILEPEQVLGPGFGCGVSKGVGDDGGVGVGARGGVGSSVVGFEHAVVEEESSGRVAVAAWVKIVLGEAVV